MWQARRVRRLDGARWLWVGAWLWLLPTLLFIGWAAGHSPQAPWRAVGDGAALYAVLLAARTLAVQGYNAIGGRAGVVLVMEDNQCTAVDWPSVWPTALLMAVVEGGAVSWTLGQEGWLAGVAAVVGWPGADGLAPVAFLALALGTVGLYNRLVVPFYGTLGWEEAAEAPPSGWVRIAAVQPDQVRLVAAALFFAWVVVWLLALVIGLLVALTALAGHLPAGTLGIGIAVFSGFVLALVGFAAAVVWSWWMYGLAVLYNRWSRAGGGLRLEVQARAVAL